MTRVGDLGEFALLRRLIAAGGAAPDAGAGVVIGAGDDAAVLRPEAGRDLVVTTDTFVAGRHWLEAWIAPETLGARLARANLSDLAAMASRPRWAVLSMALTADRDAGWAEAVQRGVAAALAREDARVVGGNVTAVDREESLTLTLIGDAAPGLVWSRAGARPGDAIAVTGFPGRAGAAAALVAALGEGARAPEWSALLDAWASPDSRVDFARALSAGGAVRAAIDLSDGLAGDLGHLCEAGGVGADLEAAAGPPDPLLERAAEALGVAPLDLRLGPSDDYELLMAVDAARVEAAAATAREAGVPWSVIGRITATPGAIDVQDPVRGSRRIEARGYDHFVRARNQR